MPVTNRPPDLGAMVQALSARLDRLERPAISGPPTTCTSTTRPTSPFVGQLIFETDTDRSWSWNGAVWLAPGTTAWQTVTLGAGWTTWNVTAGGTTYFDPACRIEGDSVQLRGLLDFATGSYGGGTIITLPVGYRPARQHLGTVMANANVAVRCDVQANGVVTSATFGSPGFLSLDGVRFPLTNA
jgi:hypothetical protein